MTLKESIYIDVLNSLSEYVVLLSADFKVVFFNEIFADLFLSENRINDCLTLADISLMMPDGGKFFNKKSLLNAKKSGPIIFTLEVPDHDLNKKIIEFKIKFLPESGNFLLSGEDKTSDFTLINLIAVLPGAVYWKDKNGVYQGCNDAMAQATGYQLRSNIIGKTDYELWPDLADGLRINDLEVMASGKLMEVEEEVVFLNGKNKTYYVAMKSPWRNANGQITGVIGNSIEITELKNTQLALEQSKDKAEAANQVKADFISSISHEFRTPMNAMMGMTQLLLMSAHDEGSKEKLNEIMRAGEHLLGLINDILDFSKLEAEKFELNNKPFSLKNHFHQTVNQLSHLLEHQEDLILDSHFSPELPEYIVGDEKCLRQILFNLGGNAIKFTKKGSVKANVFLLHKTPEKVTLRIELIDTGMGIPEKKLAVIFERFTQADSSYNRQYGGTGLGLAITKKLIDRMGGKVGVESEEGKGSCFWFELSFQIASPQQIADLIAGQKEVWSGAVLKKNPNVASLASLLVPKGAVVTTLASEILLNKHVVMIEDDRLNQLVLNGMLERLGGSAVVFADAGSVLAYLRTTTVAVDLILSDIGLPDMNGVELIKLIRQDDRYATCPIFAVTGFSGKDETERFIAIGANAVLTKPVSFTDLKEQIHYYLEIPPLFISTPTPALDAIKMNAPGLGNIFDYARTLEQLSNNADLVSELLVLLSHELPDYQQKIKTYIQTHDGAHLAAVSHKLEGSVSMLYMQRLQEAAAAVTQSVRRMGFSREVVSLAETLLAEIETVRKVLTRYEVPSVAKD